MDGTGRRRRLAKALGKYLFNPLVRALFAAGITPPGTVLLETTGRRTGEPRRTPVTRGLDGDTLWIVSEHGRHAGYVRNIEAQPQVRVRIGRHWRTGTARVVPDADPRERLAWLRAQPGARLNARTIERVGTDLLVVRVDLDDPSPTARRTIGP